MLVTFVCEAYEDITMFGNVASDLIKRMGHSGTIPGAILAKDVPQALARLKQSLGRGNGTTAPSGTTLNNDDDEEEYVSMQHRAFPLLKLLQAAEQKPCDVLWKYA